MTNYQNDEQNPRRFLKAITTIHLAMLMAQVLFLIVVIYLNSTRGIVQPSENIFLYVAPAIGVLGVLLSNLLFKSLLNKIKAKESLREKIMAYQAAILVRLALLEGPSLFGIITYLLTGNLLLLSVPVLLILYFLTLRPSKESVLNDLDLSFDHTREFNDGNGFLN